MAGDTTSPDRSETLPNILEVQRGETFALFPNGELMKGKSNIIDSRIHVKGIAGEFVPNFSTRNAFLHGELESLIDIGRRVILLTKDGPINLVVGNDTASRLVKDKHLELISWSIPKSIAEESGIEINLSAPRFTAKFKPDFEDFGEDYNYAYPLDEDGKDISALIVPLDPDFLKKIRVEIG